MCYVKNADAYYTTYYRCLRANEWFGSRTAGAVCWTCRNNAELSGCVCTICYQQENVGATHHYLPAGPGLRYMQILHGQMIF